MNKKQNAVLEVNPKALSLGKCVELAGKMLSRIYDISQDYKCSSDYLVSCESICFAKDKQKQLSVTINYDVKTLGLIAALSQAGVVFSGSTDRGKTLLGEYLLSALFGDEGTGWWAIQVNRALHVDDFIKINDEKLNEMKISESMESAQCLSFPASLVDELNRASPKVVNLLFNILDGKRFRVRGDLYLDPGMPYRVNGIQKRFSWSICTRNPVNAEYSGTFDEDKAGMRRIPLWLDFDQIPFNPSDIAEIIDSGTPPKTFMPNSNQTFTAEIIQIYEAIKCLIPMSVRAELFLNFLAGRNSCSKTRSGRIDMERVPGICENCHLLAAHKYCGRVGGLTEGLLRTVETVSRAVALVRASKSMKWIHSQCLEIRKKHFIARLQESLECDFEGQKLYKKFHDQYLANLVVTEEDIKIAYVLVATNNVWCDETWLSNHTAFEGKRLYLFRQVAEDECKSMIMLFTEHRDLLNRYLSSPSIEAADIHEIDTICRMKDPAFNSLKAALGRRNIELEQEKKNNKDSESIWRVA